VNTLGTVLTRIQGQNLDSRSLRHARCPNGCRGQSQHDDRPIYTTLSKTIQTGVDGLDIVIGTSHFLREYSHGKDMAYITKTAIEVIEFVKSKGLEVRCEFPSRALRIRMLIVISLKRGLFPLRSGGPFIAL